MSSGNTYKHKIRNTFHYFLNKLAGRNLNSRALTDFQFECIKFGICSFIPKNQKKFLIFITKLGEKMKIKTSHSTPKIL